MQIEIDRAKYQGPETRQGDAPPYAALGSLINIYTDMDI